MRLLLSVLFIAIVFAVPAVLLGDAVFERESRDQTAASRIGTEFTWPDNAQAADPKLALRILTEAADDTGLNVLRTSVGTSGSGRDHITHFVLMGRDRTGLFDEFRLARGRWLNRTESRAGSAVVSSRLSGTAGSVGVPRVFANGYDLTFAPLHRAFDALPSAGRYVVESGADEATDRFLAAVHRRMTDAGVTDVDIEDLSADGTRSPVHGGSGLRVLPYLLAGAATLVVVLVLLREGKRIGVLRLLGHSAPRIWYRVVGRQQLASVFIGLLACVAVALTVPGVDSAFMWSVGVALAEVAAAGFVTTIAAGLLIIHRVHVADLIKGSTQ